MTTQALRDWKCDEMVRLWMEMLQHGKSEYGSVKMRTHSDQPANNTPLMLMAK